MKTKIGRILLALIFGIIITLLSINFKTYSATPPCPTGAHCMDAIQPISNFPVPSYINEGFPFEMRQISNEVGYQQTEYYGSQIVLDLLVWSGVSFLLLLGSKRILLKARPRKS